MSAEDKNIVDVICIKWGTWYTAEYVNKLKRMVKRNTSYEVAFHCFTEIAEGLDSDVIVHPLPVMHMDMADCKGAFIKEAGLCDDTLGGLTGKRVFYFDLDSLIVGTLDDLFAYPRGDGFYIVRDWAHPQGNVGQASLYSWRVGTLGHIKTFFEQNAKAMFKKYGSASQEYLSDKVVEKFGALNFFPENWICSFRFHCLPLGILRWFVAPRIPNWKGLKMVAFHGLPKMSDAIIGVWPIFKRRDGWKKIYKHVKPTPWIVEHWR